MGSGKKFWSWLVVAVGVVVAACSSNLVPSGGEEYEIVGGVLNPGKIMSEAGCVRIQPGASHSARKVVTFPPSGGAKHVFDCTTVADSLIGYAIQSFLFSGGQALRQYYASAQVPGFGECSELDEPPTDYEWLWVMDGTFTVSNANPNDNPSWVVGWTDPNVYDGVTYCVEYIDASVNTGSMYLTHMGSTRLA